MIRFVAIVFASALVCSAQTATNRCAFDQANSAFSEHDFIAAGLFETTLGGWFPFMVAPTNASTFATGSASADRWTLTQSTAANQPAWSTNGMTFDGINDRLVSSGQPTGLFYGIRLWVHLTNTVVATNAARDLFTRRADTLGQTTKVEFGTATGLLTNETITLIPTGTVRVGITNQLSTGWHHLVLMWQSTNYSFYLDGARPPHVYANSANPAVTNVSEYWLGGDVSSTSSFLNATIDDFALLTNAWAEAQITVDYTNGLRRRGL